MYSAWESKAEFNTLILKKKSILGSILVQYDSISGKQQIFPGTKLLFFVIYYPETYRNLN